MTEVLTFIVVGLAAGSVYGLAGTGLVLTFKTSGIFNFAHGAIAALGAYAFYELHELRGVAWPVAAVVCVGLVAPVAGLGLERLARGLRGASQSGRIVATVGLLLAVQGAAAVRYGTESKFFPPFLPDSTVGVLGARVGVDQMIVVVIAAAASAGLALLFRTTRLGAAMRAVVDDPDLLDLAGTDPVRVQRLAWSIGAAFAVASGILIAPSIGLDAVLLTFLVVQAFGAAAIGRFSSLLGTYLGGLVVGVVAALATGYLGTINLLEGLPASLPFFVLFIVLIATPRRRFPQTGDAPVARRPVGHIVSGRLRYVATAAAVVTALLVPWVVGARLPIFTNAVIFTIAFLSLAMLVNLSGQVSLCHAAFAALGATTFAHLTTGAGVPWLVALLLAGLAVVPLGAAVAVPATRLSGVYLALATFGLGILLERMVYPSAVMFGAGGTRTAPRPGVIGLADDTRFYYLALAIAGASAVLVVSLRRARLGRLLVALSDGPEALTVLGVATNVTKVLVFCISAFLAGIAGGLFASLGGSVSGVAYSPLQSLLWLAVLALGGRGLVSTAVIAALAFAVLPAYGETLLADYQPLVFGASAIAAALLGTANLRVRERVDGLATRAGWRLARSPVRSRVVEAGASS